MRNIDKIKSMSIEEMAEWFTSPDNDFHLYCHNNCCCPSEFTDADDCKYCMQKFLESEVE